MATNKEQILDEVNAERDKDIAASNANYDETIKKLDSGYQDRIAASEKWSKEQQKNQQAQTDFAIEQINQQKDQAEKDYIKEQSGAYKDWQKQSNPYGVNAEKMAAQGMQNTGYAESSQVAYYNQYQNRVMAAREAHNQAVLNLNNAITEARLQNSSVLAEIALTAYKEQAELAIQRVVQTASLTTEKLATQREIKNTYHNRYLAELDNLYKEETLAENKRQFDANMAFQREQWEWQKAKAEAASSSGSSGGSSGGSKKITKSTGKASQGGGSNKGVIKGGSKSGKKTKVSSSEPKVDMTSVMNLGYGPISAGRLNELIKQGLVKEYEENGKLKYKRSGFAKKSGTYMLR